MELATTDQHSIVSASEQLPSVLVIVVTHAPGAWFDTTLESLAELKYPNLKYLFIDTAGDATDRIKETIPKAVVIHAPHAKGFADGVNTIFNPTALIKQNFNPELLVTDFLLICHDDIAPEPEALETLVKETLASGAAVAGPKLLDWDQPEVIQHVGLEVDRFGVPADLSGVGELDQEQYNRTEQVFAVHTAAMLVRTDLFKRLGGFDPKLPEVGEDVDFCWRAQTTGAKVALVGEAVVHHREQRELRSSANKRHAQQSQLHPHHKDITYSSLRTMLVNHGPISLACFVPLAGLMSLIEILVCLLAMRLGRIRSVISGWFWNLVRINSALKQRTIIRHNRARRAADVSAQQYFGSFRALNLVRRGLGGSETSGASITNSKLVGSLGDTVARGQWFAWIVAAVFVVFGSRALIGSGVPQIGDFASFGTSANNLIGDWWSGWSDRDTGVPTSNLGGLLWLGLAGIALERVGSSLEFLRTAAVLIPICLGIAGAYRMLAPTGSQRAQGTAMFAYMFIPLAWAATASGSMPGLIAYALAPWLVSVCLAAVRLAPFGAQLGDTGRERSTSSQGALKLGVIVGIASLFAPSAAILATGLVIAGIAVGSLLVAQARACRHLLAMVALAAPVVAVLILPMLLDLLAAGFNWAWLSDGYSGSARFFSLAELLRFAVGPSDAGAYVWLIFAPMILPLVIARGWRLDVSVQLWSVALVSWLVAMLTQSSLLASILNFGLGDVSVLLAPAAAGAAGLIGMAALTIDQDVRFRLLGWRHAVLPVIAIAVLAVTIGGFAHINDGRWGLARASHFDQLELELPVLSGAYRVLWIGSPQHLPVQGRQLDDTLAWATTEGNSVDITDWFATFDDGESPQIQSLLEDISAGNSNRVGRDLAELGVRYVVVLRRLTPSPFSSQEHPIPADLTDGLRRQLDLAHQTGTNSAIDVYVNTSWVPMRAYYPAGTLPTNKSTSPESASLVNGAAIFSANGPPWSAEVPASSDLLVLNTARKGWKLSVDDQEVGSQESLGWARAYTVNNAGTATLDYDPPAWRRFAQIVSALAPLVLAAVWLRRRLDTAIK